MRIGVVGGGIAGLMTAWLLAPRHDVVVYEAAPNLGGNAANRSIRFRGERVVVTPGATHLLGAGAYPLTHRLLGALGVTTETLGSRLSLVGEDGELRWTSELRQGRRSGLAWSTMAESAAGWADVLARGWRLEAARDWSVTWRELRASLRTSGASLERVVEPVVAGFWGVRPSAMGELSARALLAYLVRPLPGPRRWWPGHPVLVRGGTGRLVDALAGDLGAVAQLCRSTPVEAVTAERSGQVVRHALGSDRVDAVVVATPPWEAARIVGGPMSQRLAGLRATPTEIVVHADQPPWSRSPSPSTVVVAGADRAQLSTLVGSAGGTRVRRSWATWGGPEPETVLWRGRFCHVAPTPELFELQHSIAARQGTDRRWFAGSWTVDVDSLESSLVSALDVAGRIDGRAARVRWLQCGRNAVTGRA